MGMRLGGFRRNGGKEPAPNNASAVGEEREALALLRDYENSGLGWFWASDAQGNITYVSGCAASVLDQNPQALIGRPFHSLFYLDDEAGAGNGRTLPLLLGTHKTFSAFTTRARNQGEEVWWAISGRPQHDSEGNFLGYRGNGADVTEALIKQRDSSRLALFDSLTGLANRHSMTQRLSNTLSAFKSSQRSCALMMIDLDRFKQVNDTLGHPAGDALLKQVAERLHGVIGKQGEIGRLGGDEFQVIIPDCDDRGKLGELAKRIIALISQPYSIDSSRCMIGASIGIAVAPFDGADCEELVSNADLALYAAKGGGRGQFRFFSIELQNNAEKRKVLEEGLRDALADGQIRLAYQPVVNAHSNQVVGLEALMRWEHPDFGELPPSMFIPLAEESELIVALGEWALRHACHQVAEWPGGVSVSVNIATAQFARNGFVASVAQALAEAELEPYRLELEFPEGVFACDEVLLEETFAQLKQLGVKLSLDNFGAGDSPLANLRSAPFDKIKIDRTVIQDITNPRSRSAAIAASIVTLAKKLGMETTAEGIEARDELTMMIELGIDQIQGFIYASPCSGEQVTDALATGQWVIQPDGPARQRADRRTVLRRVGVIHEDFRYDVMMRNLSRGGAAVEGLMDVPVGTEFVLDLGEGQLVVATARRSEGAEQGLEFEISLVDDGAGGLVTRHRVPRHLLDAMGMPQTGYTTASVIALNTTGGLHLPKFATSDSSTVGRAA